MEVVSNILTHRQLPSKTLDQVILRHLIAQSKAYITRFSIGLKNKTNEFVVEFNVMNSTFLILSLLEVFVEGLDVIDVRTPLKIMNEYHSG